MNLLRRLATARRIKLLIIAACTVALNIVFLGTLVGALGVAPIVADVCRLITSHIVRFYLQRRIACKINGLADLSKHIKRYAIANTATTTTYLLMFWTMIAVNTPYMLAFLICTAIVGAISIEASNKYVFTPQTSNPSSAR